MRATEKAYPLRGGKHILRLSNRYHIVVLLSGLRFDPSPSTLQQFRRTLAESRENRQETLAYLPVR